MWSSLVILALLATAQGRAVNISNTWVLPEEGFPVFYRYFRDRISWYEADAVCQFHHANLVTVDTTAQYDAVRAYLKELDISSAVWVGLIRSNPDGDFTWTDYRGLSGDGYWSSAPDTRSAPLCAAANPAADYRWEARACGGPTVASFICELPVPQWALGNEGCMVRELPALTILYLPESAAVQLNADCGLAGVKRVQCTGNVKREGLLKDLSCADEEEISSTSPSTSSGTIWPATTDITADQDTSDITTEENTITEHEVNINQPIVITATSLPQYINSKTRFKSPTKFTDMDNFNTVSFSKEVNLGETDDHNIQSNFIPKHVDDGNVLTNEQLQKLEDERHMQHKMLHEEIARVGNVDNIFTQPTDHFIPPLVMAKSRMSDDMTVLSLAEKHAQQMAEKQFRKHSYYTDVKNHNKLSYDNIHIDKPLIISIKPNKEMETKKDNLKTHVPKKYVNEKYYDTKVKAAKMWESKTTEKDKPTVTTQTPTTTYDKTTTFKGQPHYLDKIDKDFAMDLTIILKERNNAPITSEEQTVRSNYADDVARFDTITNQTESKTSEEQTVRSNYADDVAKLDTITNQTVSKTSEEPTVRSNYADDVANLDTITNQTMSLTNESNIFNISDETSFPAPNIKTVDNSTMEHEVIQITVISNDDPNVNTTNFDITTKMPIFRDDTGKTHPSFFTLVSKDIQHTEGINVVTSESTSKVYKKTTISEATTVPVTISAATVTDKLITVNVTTEYVPTSTKTELVTTNISLLVNNTEIIEMPTTMSTTSFFNISNVVTTQSIDNLTTDLSTENHNDSTSIESNASLEKLDFNSIEHDLLEKNMTESEEMIDENSPLLSGAYEPMHRPPRTRRPQQPNRKFNPFRILG